MSRNAENRIFDRKGDLNGTVYNVVDIVSLENPFESVSNLLHARCRRAALPCFHLELD